MNTRPITTDILGTPADFDQIGVERAFAEFRAARPVAIRGTDGVCLALGIESATPEMLAWLELEARGRALLILPAARLRRIGLADRKTPGAIALPVVDAARIETLALRTDGKIDAPVAAIDPLADTALQLAALALTLPAVILVPVETLDPRILVADQDAIIGYREARARDIHIVGRAPVPLEGAKTCEFVVFRGGEGMRDQVAIIVGKPDLDNTVSVRLHSACLTGDLFGSLKCDCGDQLRDTVRWMAENEGGVLLYLDQEGRGNGIANKMRAYKLQSQGFDTYEADEVLGFDLDQRRFGFAAEMLKQLGIARVRLMTNNPEKIAALGRSGLEVVGETRVLGRPTAENVRYLASKRDRAGHFIDFEALAARASIKD